ncbi:hypothetical protein ER308_07295 [Egibacter rhizosphaerae]|uniref:Uncharacterized protein n=1 Tax=Egibacter rhizosphaerae TaxID=1670831 RepID=A0A411YDX0_9ACTN|nr:hypothetical protein [Egibacter rhizosphaerae]QBI19370.1 hypothetical protein ER308_07295 [Egibacter rhizosphaerae]
MMRSVEQVRAAHCDSKTAYPNRFQAKFEADKASDRTGELIRAYRCVFCPEHFHIGHPPTYERLEELAWAARRHAQGEELPS